MRLSSLKLLLVLVASLFVVTGARALGSSPVTQNTTYLPVIVRPARGPNLLPNASFEGGWYHPNGIPELQIPDRWLFEWDEGENPFSPDPWNDFVRPEVRVLPATFLPPEEHELFIWDGEHTVKIFKDWGAISIRLLTDVYLQPGAYLLEASVFPDLIVDYVNGEKVWAPDPLSGEVRLIAGSGDTGWLLPAFGQKNTFVYSFTVSHPQTVRVGVALRGRYAIRNNGWFMDDWWLYQIGN